MLDLNDAAFLKIKRQFENKLNKVFAHALLSTQLDSEEIDFAVMHMLEQTVKSERLFASDVMQQQPVFKALQDLNILWKSKYYGYFAIEHPIYVDVVKQWLF